MHTQCVATGRGKSLSIQSLCGRDGCLFKADACSSFIIMNCAHRHNSDPIILCLALAVMWAFSEQQKTMAKTTPAQSHGPSILALWGQQEEEAYYKKKSMGFGFNSSSTNSSANDFGKVMLAFWGSSILLDKVGITLVLTALTGWLWGLFQIRYTQSPGL